MINKLARTLTIALFLSTSVNAAPLPKESVPDPLKTWVPWVLHGAEEALCPQDYAGGEARRCAWPARLALRVDDKGGTFAQEVLAFRAVWIALPGDAKHWPQDVKIDGKPALVVAREERPGVEIVAGAHTVTGNFLWDALPENLPVPPQTGLVALTLSGAAITAPNVDAAGRLWLKQQASAEGGAERIELRVSRLVRDDVPLTVTTHLELVASGKSQEITLPNALLPRFVALSLDSALPARFDESGRVRVQVRPGRWEINVGARYMAPLKELQLPASNDALAAKEEIWAFEAHNDLRLVTVEGVAAVDPQQTTLPQDWKRLPAFLLKPGDTMRFNESKRGDPEPAPDQLTLARNLWLDFDGGGYTIQDQISGAITRAWRMDMGAPQALGRVAVDGVDQYITRLDAKASAGVELRKGQANITADSRLDSSVRTLSATGWQHDFNQLSAKLHLPPGWRLLHASGVDRAPTSWIERWTLLDFFLVLIIALASGKLFGWRWGIAALLALALSYHENGAPNWVWLNLLAAIGLLRLLPQGKAHDVVNIYRWVSVIVLALWLVPFTVDQIRHALYPVLERRWERIGDESTYAERGAAAGQAAPIEADQAMQAEPAAAPPAAPASKPAASPEADVGDVKEKTLEGRRANVASSPRNGISSYSVYDKQRTALDQIDPNAKIQTGPGLPHWRWNEHDLIWSGPVEHSQTLHLWLISPALSGVLTVARLALVLLLFAVLVAPAALRSRGIGRGAPAAALLLVALLGSAIPRQSFAQQTPPQEVLDQLRQKLLAPADCMPRCAEIARLRVDASGNTLQLRIEAHAAAQAAIPLPGGAQQWSPEKVSVDGTPATGLARDAAGKLWAYLDKGVHQIAMEAPLAGRNAAQLPLPLKPRRVEAHLDGWTVEGIGENGEPAESLFLTRVVKDGVQAQTASGESLPPFVQVERTLNLGLTWQIATRVARAGPSNAPVIVEIPLIAGESVTHPDVRVQDGVAVVNLGPQSKEFAFESALKESAALSLKAPAHANQIQVWRLNLGPQWHASLAGIAVIHHQDADSHWLPQWQPWPKEEVKLALSKPIGLEGQTLTLDRSALTLSPGIRATDASLQLVLRASRGGQHVVKLPEGAVLQSVMITAQTQPIRLEGREIKLPIAPGKQEILIAWREPRGMAARFETSFVDAGIAGVNGTVEMKIPQDRWPLLIGGPAIGPAILFWGILIALVLIAVAFGKVLLTPLKWWQWFLLGLGLTQVSLATSAVVAGWFIVLGLRPKWGERGLRNSMFNAGQIAVVAWTMLALSGLFWAVKRGLLGYPEMQVTGNGSDAYHLRWYQDRTRAALPQAWVVSVPLLAYRLLMLAWALWLAYSLLKWLRWAWTCFSDHGYWRKLALWKKPAAAANAAETSSSVPNQ